VEHNTSYVAAATRAGAAFLGVRSERASLVNAGWNDTRTPNSVLVAGLLDARCIAFNPAPAPTTQLVPLGGRLTAAVPTAVMPSAEQLPSVNHARKQTTNVHKTRISAGGYGAMGPHPEREPA
jgi:hypothetical protein